MKMKNNLILCCAAGILFGSALGNLNAQTGKSLTQGNQLFTEKVDMSITGNKDGIYYLLLCKLLPNATSKISGTIKLETIDQETLNIVVSFSTASARQRCNRHGHAYCA